MSTRKAKFEVGDRIKNIAGETDLNSNNEKLGRVSQVDFSYSERPYLIKYDDGSEGQGGENDYKLIKENKKTIMSRISTMMKKLLDADTQKLIQAGFIDSELDLTSEGATQLNIFLFMANKADMVKLAEEAIAEREKNKNN